MKYSDRHGGPFDRGMMDCYYGRKYNPHFFVGNTYTSPLVEEKHMTKEEVDAYKAGWDYNYELGDFKDWG